MSDVRTLRHFIDDDLGGGDPATNGAMDAESLRMIVDLAQRMVEHVYVHLPMKRMMHAVEPVQRLKLLRNRLGDLTPAQFHREMLAIFNDLRDYHTGYILPKPYQDAIAFLPFEIGEYFVPKGEDAYEARYTVTQFRDDLPGIESKGGFGRGVEVTHWNGVPIGRVVELNAEREAGCNRDARHARGLVAMTRRPLGMTRMPDEDWVVIGYTTRDRDDGVQVSDGEIRFLWLIEAVQPAPTTAAPAPPAVANAPSDSARQTGQTTRRFADFVSKHAGRDRTGRLLSKVASGRANLEADVHALAKVATAEAPAGTADGASETHLGIDARHEISRRSRKLLFCRAEMADERTMADAAEQDSDPVDQARTSLLPDVFQFRTIPAWTQGEGTWTVDPPADGRKPDREFGYIRIASFNCGDPLAARGEFVRILTLPDFPQDGLILDVRQNPGGNIVAGEYLLQALTPGPIQPAPFHFLNAPMTLELCGRLPQYRPWQPSIARAIETGETLSEGFPLSLVAICDTPEAELRYEASPEYNGIGQQYQGPVVLVVDAICYSTTDIFAAGFEDHDIGKVIGTSRSTGAGGANVWFPDDFRRKFPDWVIPTLPKDASFHVAMRRSTRVGRRAGEPLEEFGVTVPDDRFHYHRTTRRDLLGDPGEPPDAAVLDRDLLAFAVTSLAGERVHRLAVSAGPGADGAFRLTFEASENIDRVDIYERSTGRPWKTHDLARGDTIDLPGDLASSEVEVRGFDGGRWAVSIRKDLAATASS